MKQSEKQKEWKKRHYNENKEFYASKQSERRKTIKEYIESFKNNCSVCDESDVACLDFHHINGDEKSDTLSMVIKNKWGNKRIHDEMNKCVVLCSNCHRKLHYYNFSIDELTSYVNTKRC